MKPGKGAFQIDRRMMLRGLGGAAISAPFLGSVVERAARAQGTPFVEPRRLIVLFTHHGCLTDHWFPTRSHGELTAADYESTSLAPLAPYADKLLMPRGIRAMNQWTNDFSLGQVNDPHLQACGSFFTCMPVTPNSEDPYSFGEAKFQAQPIGRSLDHVCAEQLSSSGLPLLLNVSGEEATPSTAISYSAAETPFPGTSDLAAAFSELTGLFSTGEPSSPDSYEVARGKSLVDLVREDLDTMERFDMSVADARKLEAWKELLDGMGQRVGAMCNAELAQTLALSASNLKHMSGEDHDRLTFPVGDGLDRADLFSGLAVLSAACDQHRVIVLKYPAQHQFTGLGLSYTSANLANRIVDGTGACPSDVDDALLKIDSYYAKKFAYLVDTLDSIPDGEGSLLDGSAAVWFQEMSDGYAHNLNNLPILIAGSCGGYFKLGQAINVEDGSPDLTRGKSSGVCLERLVMSEMGTPVDQANAPINKLFCNLMNATRVRAGQDGFPQSGGEEEVTHFGMYDRTEDFVGGGVEPPLISSPGAYSELKAT